MGQVLECNFAFAHVQWLGIWRVQQGDGLGDRLHPLRHDAQRAEERGQRPHDPAGHRVEPQRQSRRRSDSADACRALRPKVNRPAHNAYDQQAIQRHQHQIHQCEDPHLAREGLAGLLDRFLGELDFPVVMGEELDGVNVGIAVNDAPCGHGARVRRCFRRRPHALHRPMYKPRIKPEPDHQGDR